MSAILPWRSLKGCGFICIKFRQACPCTIRNIYKLEKKCVPRTLMPPPSTLGKIAPWWDVRADEKPCLRQARQITEACAQTVSADCELDIWLRDMLLAQDTLSCLDDHSCQIIFKSHHAGWGYSLNTRCLCTNCNCGLCLTFVQATWFLHATFRLVVMIISAKLFSNPTNFQMKLWVGHDSGMHKLKVPAVTLTFDLATWFLHTTLRLLLMIISVK